MSPNPAPLQEAAGQPNPPLLDEEQLATKLCSCTSETFSCLTGEIYVLHVGGEVDLLSLPVLACALDAHLDQRPEHLIVDLAQLTFCSARGLSALADADVTARAHGVDYAVSATPSWLVRVWTSCWPAEQLPARYPDLASAVTAVRAREAADRVADPRSSAGASAV